MVLGGFGDGVLRAPDFAGELEMDGRVVAGVIDVLGYKESVDFLQFLASPKGQRSVFSASMNI